jgi:hypothetical protein
MKTLSPVVVSALVLVAGTALAAGSGSAPTRPGTTASASAASLACFDRCASKRPPAAAQKALKDCLKPHYQAMKPQVSGLKKKSREGRAAAWKEILQARQATADRCLPASFKAWNDCMTQCRGR